MTFDAATHTGTLPTRDQEQDQRRAQQDPADALRNAPVRRGRAGADAAPRVRREDRLDRRPHRRRRHGQQDPAREPDRRGSRLAYPRLHRRPSRQGLPPATLQKLADRDRRLVLERDIARAAQDDLRPARARALARVPRHVQLDREAGQERERRDHRAWSRHGEAALPGADADPFPPASTASPSGFWTSGWTMLLIALLIPALLARRGISPRTGTQQHGAHAPLRLRLDADREERGRRARQPRLQRNGTLARAHAAGGRATRRGSSSRRSG